MCFNCKTSFQAKRNYQSPTQDETPNLFQTLENVKIKTQKQKLLDEINKRLSNLKAESSINVINEEDAS